MKGADDWGSYNENSGKWNGMIRKLLDKEADLALTYTANIAIRRTVVDFSMHLCEFHLVALFRRQTFRRNQLALLLPFDKFLWLAIFTWCVIWTVALYVLQASTQSSVSEWGRPTEYVLYAVAMLCGMGLTPCGGGGFDLKIRYMYLTFSGHLVAFVLSAAYSGILFSFLSHREEAAVDLSSFLKNSPRLVFALDYEDSFLIQQRVKVTNFNEVRGTQL